MIAFLVLTNLFSLMFLVSMYRTMFTSPGRIPDTKEWREIPTARTGKSELKRTTGGQRYCRWCRKTKPDRAHHCRVCDECTLKMDHHCPWLGNCIGFRNYKFFVLTLLYGGAALLNCALASGGMSIFLGTAHGALDTTENTVRFSFSITLCVASFVGWTVVSIFSSIHAVMILKGLTTIEVFEKGGASGEDGCCLKTLCCESKSDPGYVPSRYKLSSAFDNIKAALGEDWYFWLIPTKPRMGTGSADGLQYEVNFRPEIDEDDSPLLPSNMSY